MSEEDALYARLKVVAPHRSEQQWRDAWTLPEPFRTETLRAWLETGDDWVQRPDYFVEVVAVVTALVSLAGAVSGIAGAVSAVQSLKF